MNSANVALHRRDRRGWWPVRATRCAARSSIGRDRSISVDVQVRQLLEQLERVVARAAADVEHVARAAD